MASVAVHGTEMAGEGRMLEPLLAWLRQTGRVNNHTTIACELLWFGRRVDLATLSVSRRSAAYELKIGGLGRALEQASYNRLAFDRSYVVTNAIPRAENIAVAAEHGIGMIVVQGVTVRRILESPARPPDPLLRHRLLSRFRDVGRDHV